MKAYLKWQPFCSSLSVFNYCFTGEIQTRGVMLPFTREIYNPMLKRLKAEGLTAKETIIRGNNITAY